MLPEFIVKAAPALFLFGAGSSALVTTVKSGGLVTTGKDPSKLQLSDHVPSRTVNLQKARESTPIKPFDILVIGGGATGTGCAVDAATRGLRTCLVEREDFGSGTSSKSTKLAHGGVRYLEKAVFNLDLAQLKLVYEALHERRHILTNAAHLSTAMPILTPCYKWWEVPYYWAGMKAYDVIAGLGALAWSKYCGPTECLATLPTMAREMGGRTLKGAIMYYDGAFDDARLNVTLATSAAAAGAAVINYAECVALLKNAEGEVVGARCMDRVSGGEFEVHARVVVNATGPFLDGVRREADDRAATSVTAAAGAHVTLPAYYGSPHTGLIIPKTSDGRVVFMLPFQGAVIAGTTDAPCPVTSRPRATDQEVAFILDTVSDYLGVHVQASDVLSAWSGIRPLAHVPAPSSGAGAPSTDTSSIVRDHVIFTDPHGLINVSGGKWTTYRRMAEDVVNEAVASGRLPLSTRPCVTSDLPLLGSQAYRPSLAAELAQHYRAGVQAAISGSTAASGEGDAPAPPAPRLTLDAPTATHLAHAYGDRAHMVLTIAERSGLGRPLVHGHPLIEAEVVHAVQSEYCVTVEDFVCRRTRLATLDARAALACLPRVGELMGGALGWSARQREEQVASARRYISATYFAGASVDAEGEEGGARTAHMAPLP